jgi:hypothetical protein
LKTLHILNLGAGVQSTTLYLMGLRRDEPEHVPAFDCAIFADTQEEPRAVYEHLEWLKSLGGPPILEVTAGKLGDDLSRGVHSTGQRFASIPCFTKSAGADREGRTRRQCTREYKTRPIEQAIRRRVLGLEPGRRVPRGVEVHQYLGLSFDEPGRVISTRARFQAVPWSVPHFPLYDLEMTRRGCVAYLESAAPGRAVPRSACVFCPFRTNEEWRRLRGADPVGWARAVEVDEALRTTGSIANRDMGQTMYLHRSCKPLREAAIDTPESRGEQYTFGFASECEGMCGL